MSSTFKVRLRWIGVQSTCSFNDIKHVSTIGDRRYDQGHLHNQIWDNCNERKAEFPGSRRQKMWIPGSRFPAFLNHFPAFPEKSSGKLPIPGIPGIPGTPYPPPTQVSKQHCVIPCCIVISLRVENLCASLPNRVKGASFWRKKLSKWSWVLYPIISCVSHLVSTFLKLTSLVH